MLKMASKSNGKALYFFCLLLMVRGQFFQDESEKSSDGQHLYPCWTFAGCQGEGPEFEEVQQCLSFLQPEDIISSMKYVKNGFYEYESVDINGAMKEYCDVRSEQREDAFERTTKGLISYYMSVCSSPGTQAECKRWDNALDCILPFLDKLEEQKKCIIDQ